MPAMAIITDLLSVGFLQRALIAGLCVAVLAPSIGVFLVSRRYAFLADALAHVSLAGVAVGLLLQTEPVAVALVFSVAAALLLEELRMRAKKLPGEALLALFLSGGLALASVVLSLQRGASVSLSAVLFGNILTVTESDVWIIALLSAVVLLILFVLRRPLFALCLDEELARSSGLPVAWLSRILVILAAVTVSLSMRIVGVLLVGALMVIPALIGQTIMQSFRGAMLVAVAAAVSAVVIGMGASYAFDVATGGAIVLVALTLFLVSLLFRRT